MAKGYPDYYGIPMFPSYLGTTRKAEREDILTTDETTIASVLGKGVLYFARFRSASSVMNGGHRLALYIDDTETARVTVTDLLKKSVFVGQPFAWAAVAYDVVNNYYEFVIQPSFPFVTNAYITFKRSGVAGLSIYGTIIYSLIVD